MLALWNSWMGQSQPAGLSARQRFGTVTERNNTNITQRGFINRGTISNNAEMNVNVIRCELDLKDNTDTKIVAEKSKLNVRNCEDTKIFGKHHEIKLQGDTGTTVKGERVKLEANNNTDLSITNSSDCTLKFKGNTKAEVEAVNGTITVEGSRDILIRTKDSDVKMYSCSETKALGRGNNYNLNREEGFKAECEDVKLQSSKNKNVSVGAKECTLRLENNDNVDIRSLDNGYVEAKNNKNLVIHGPLGAYVRVYGTKNHSLRKVRAYGPRHINVCTFYPTKVEIEYTDFVVISSLWLTPGWFIYIIGPFKMLWDGNDAIVVKYEWGRKCAQFVPCQKGIYIYKTTSEPPHILTIQYESKDPDPEKEV